MKNKFQILVMLLALVAFVLQRQVVFAQSSAFTTCCEAQKGKTSHTDKKDNSHCNHHDSTEHHNCNQDNCCSHCGHCQALFFSFIKPENTTAEKVLVRKSFQANFIYQTPEISTPLSEIWQPPKIV